MPPHCLVHERNGGRTPAIAARYGHVRDWLLKVEVAAGQTPHLGRPHTRPVHQFQPNPCLGSARKLPEDRVDVRALHPATLRQRRRESNEIDEVDGGTPTVEEGHQVDERMAPVVVARRGERPAPIVQLGVQVGEAAPRGPTVVPGCYDNAEPLPGELRVAITADAAGLLFNLR